MHDVIVIGGGLAGCSAAIHLAEAGRDVVLLEKGTYPKHKLCGEFLSPEAQGLFERLGVLDAVRSAGAAPINRTWITAPSGADFRADLPGTALGLSRYRLDQLLFDTACARGADGRTGTRVTGVSGNLADGFTVETSDGPVQGRAVLGAYGKRGVLDRTLDRPFLRETTPLIAFKAHYAGISLPSQVEIHAFPGGYCGLSHVEAERVNVCWIGHQDQLKTAGGTPEAMIAEAAQHNTALADRLDSMTRISDSFCAVSQISLAEKTAFEQDVCMIGDTAGMIAPLCGDGMAMALQSAEVAVPSVLAFLDERLSAEAFRQRYTSDWREAFRTRMRLGRWIQWSAFRPGVAAAVVRACHLAPIFGRWLIRSTRG
jgi:flavin-dependent dehydrogenase